MSEARVTFSKFVEKNYLSQKNLINLTGDAVTRDENTSRMYDVIENPGKITSHDGWGKVDTITFFVCPKVAYVAIIYYATVNCGMY